LLSDAAMKKRMPSVRDRRHRPAPPPPVDEVEARRAADEAMATLLLEEEEEKKKTQGKGKARAEPEREAKVLQKAVAEVAEVKKAAAAAAEKGEAEVPCRRKCAACGKSKHDLLEGEKLKKCSICEAVWYCSRGCQRGHWGQHKLGCSTLQLELD